MDTILITNKGDGETMACTSSQKLNSEFENNSKISSVAVEEAQ